MDRASSRLVLGAGLGLLGRASRKKINWQTSLIFTLSIINKENYAFYELPQSSGFISVKDLSKKIEIYENFPDSKIFKTLLKKMTKKKRKSLEKKSNNNKKKFEQILKISEKSKGPYAF